MGRLVIATIGIDRYRHWRALTNAVEDARGAAALFRRLGFEEVVPPLLDDRATGDAIEALVADELTSLGASDSLIVFYAGHGGTRTQQVGGRAVRTGYLIPVDGSDDARVTSWIEIDPWLRRIAKLPPRHILVILDACFSGIALSSAVKWGRNSGALIELPFAVANTRPSRLVITSALDDEQAMDSGPIPGHSLFTGCLMEALTGGLPPVGMHNGRPVTIGSEIGRYVRNRVQTYPGRPGWQQTPDLGTFDYDERGEMLIPVEAAVDERVNRELAALRAAVRAEAAPAALEATPSDAAVATPFNEGEPEISAPRAQNANTSHVVAPPRATRLPHPPGRSSARNASSGADVHEEMREQLARGAVTLIIGAGVSIQASGGAPRASWQGLLLDGADELRSDPDFRERYPVVEQELRSNHPDDFISAARKISRALGAPNGGRYRSWLRRAIGQLPLVDRSILDAIHGLGARIATTNYDGLLSRARDGIPPVCWTEPSRVERVLRGDEAGILHLHGYWECPESVILDARSYDQIIGDEHAQAVMRTLRLTTTLVFIGCGAGLQDPNFEQFRAWLAQVMHSSEYPSYRLALDGEADGLQRMHGAARDGVRVVGYGAKHDDLAPYLRSLVTAPAASTSPPAAFASTKDAAGTDRMVAPAQAGTSAGNPSARARPVPSYADAEVEALSKRLEDARARRDKLCSAGFAADDIDREILALRRQLREGGRLRAGDALGDGRYLLVRVVGRGGFAVVWEAYDRAEQQRVAIKVLHANLAGDPVRRERFFRGAHAMMKLLHPAVVRVLEPEGEDGGFYYYVMEFVPGGNLRETVLARCVSNDDVLPLILRIGEALALAHSRGMIHRDIKPANILLDEHGNAKLTDFDLVGAHDTTGGTSTGALGTVVYAAPECLDKPQDATARADVYGLGMTTIFCLVGHDLSLSTFRNPEPTISRLDCSAHVRGVLRRAVAWEPHDRYADAHAMTVELRSALEQPPIEPSSVHPSNAVRLGTADSVRAEPILLPLDDIKTHMAFLGSAGSGKTTAALSVVEQLLERDVSVVLVERKGDLVRYASEAWWTDGAVPEVERARKLALRKRIDVALFTPGNSHGRPLRLPLVPSFAEIRSQERERLARYAAEWMGTMMGYGKSTPHRAKTSILQCAIMLHGDERDITLDLLCETINRPDPELLNAVGALQRYFASLSEDIQTLRIMRGSLLSGGELLDLAALLPPPRSARTKLTIINTSALTEVPLLQFWISRLLIEFTVLGRGRPSATLQAAAFFDEADMYIPATSSPPTKDPMFDLLRRARSTGIGVLLATKNPADFDYKARDNIHTWLLGRITQDRAIEKMRNLIGNYPDVGLRLASQRTGSFFLLTGTSEHALQADRSLMETVQLPESEIADLARRTRAAGASSP